MLGLRLESERRHDHILVIAGVHGTAAEGLLAFKKANRGYGQQESFTACCL